MRLAVTPETRSTVATAMAGAIQALLHEPGQTEREPASLLAEDDRLEPEIELLDPPGARPACFAAGMALCIPALSILGLLYTLLK